MASFGLFIYLLVVLFFVSFGLCNYCAGGVQSLLTCSCCSYYTGAISSHSEVAGIQEEKES